LSIWLLLAVVAARVVITPMLHQVLVVLVDF
jgi:hypothetical protein